MKCPISLLPLLVACCSSLLGGPALAQSTWFVESGAPGPQTGAPASPFATIQAAIDSPTTLSGDTIEVRPGVYAELVDLGLKELVLRSTAGPQLTTIDATLQFSLTQSVITIDGGQGPACRIEGFSLVGGAGSDLVEPVLGSFGFGGGGLLLIDSSPTIVNCAIRDNRCEFGGGAFIIRGAPTFDGCLFEANTTTRFGAAIHASDSDLTLRRVIARENIALAGDAGGVHVLAGSLTMSDCTLRHNQAFNGGSGANLTLRVGAIAELVDSRLDRAVTPDGDGAGLWVDGSTALLEHCSLAHNDAGSPFSTRRGGAIFVDSGELTLSGCDLSGNQGGAGGALYALDSTVLVTDSVFGRNSSQDGLAFAISEGGALASIGSSTTVLRTAFIQNQARGFGLLLDTSAAHGGAVWCDGPGVLLEGCLFLNNEAYFDGPPDPFFQKQVPAAQGGAVFGPAVVRRSDLIGNIAHTNPAVLNGFAVGGGAFGAILEACRLNKNVVDGIGPFPDRAPAAEASLLTCSTGGGNLPSTLRPLGLLCEIKSCP